jgi:hypothetical protein
MNRVALDRHFASFETRLAALLRMRNTGYAIHISPHPEEPAHGGRLEGRRVLMQRYDENADA